MLVDELGADFVPLYRTRRVRPAEPPEGDLVVLASGSAARPFADLGAADPAVTIGPQTTRAARKCGLEVIAEAQTHDLDGLVAAVERQPPEPLGPVHHLPDRLRPRRTTSSAPVTA